MRWNRHARCALLAVHVLAASTWLGVLVTLVCSQGFTDAVMPVLLVAAPTCVVSGVLLSLGTPWGVFRYQWLQAKWALVGLVAGLAGISVALPENSGGLRGASVGLLGGAVVVSLVRPWGQRARRLSGRHRANSV